MPIDGCSHAHTHSWLVRPDAAYDIIDGVMILTPSPPLPLPPALYVAVRLRQTRTGVGHISFFPYLSLLS